ncbi:MAG TPA: hypothetical protein VK717_04560 [Opitutaceae bacterium]|jgi:hypothetical protein|nr:hypothetical protein [Opitutaceae bacterium]
MTTFTPEQKQAVTGWIAAGDSLSIVQKKLTEQFKLSLTYMDVRFLVDDLGLELKNAAPAATPEIGKAPAPKATPAEPAKKGFFDKAKEKLGFAKGEEDDLQTDIAEEDLADDPGTLDAPAGAVSVSVDKVTLIPGALASGTVTFSDGVTGKWIVDNYGRPGFTEISQPGYRPNPADAQAFMQELSRSLQSRGL